MDLLLHTFGDRLRDARERARLSQETIGALFDPPVTRNTVSNWENDKNMPESDRLPILARAVHRSIDYLMTGRGGDTSMGPEVQGKVPLISWVKAGSFADVVDNLHPGDAYEMIETSCPIHRHTYALRVDGDSMTNPNGDPTFPHGSVIIVEPDAIDSPDNLVNKLVIVKRAGDHEATFKKLVRDGGSFLLMPLNPRYPPLELKEGDVFCGVVRAREQRFF